MNQITERTPLEDAARLIERWQDRWGVPSPQSRTPQLRLIKNTKQQMAEEMAALIIDWRRRTVGDYTAT